jgi:hypothetical protein
MPAPKPGGLYKSRWFRRGLCVPCLSGQTRHAHFQTLPLLSPGNISGIVICNDLSELLF